MFLIQVDHKKCYCLTNLLNIKYVTRAPDKKQLITDHVPEHNLHNVHIIFFFCWDLCPWIKIFLVESSQTCCNVKSLQLLYSLSLISEAISSYPAKRASATEKKKVHVATIPRAKQQGAALPEWNFFQSSLINTLYLLCLIPMRT